MLTKLYSYTKVISFSAFLFCLLAFSSCTNDNSDGEGELEYVLPDEETGKDPNSKKVSSGDVESSTRG